MKNVSNVTSATSTDSLIASFYKRYYQSILNYITYRINHKYEAEDLAQDVFVRLLDYKAMLREDTAKYFLFSIARNIVTDYIRRYYKKQEITSYIYDAAAHVINEPEANCVANSILELEQKKLETFSPQCKKIYHLSRFEEKTVAEISDEMQLSKRTIENQLLKGRKIMRTYIRQCI